MNRPSSAPLVLSGIFLGIGMGGFVDGIVFHQLLQFHNMLSAKYPPTSVVHLEVNMFWDGIFHTFTWIMTAVGIAVLWCAVRQPDAYLSGRSLVGSICLGWGLFNLVEGVINHHVLHLHHVREVPGHLPWDLAFLASGAILMTLGFALIRSANTNVSASRSDSVQQSY